MKNQGTGEKKISKNLHDIRRRSHDQFLTLKGINVEQFRVWEQETNKEYAELVAVVEKRRKQGGKERAEEHIKSLEKRRMAMKRKGQEFGKTLSLLSSLTIQDLGKLVKPIPIPLCFPIETLSENVGTGDDDGITVDAYDEDDATTSLDYDTDENQAQPYLKVWGPGTGDTNSATIKASYKFAFTPASSGKYCIDPLVYMSGYWLLWTWGTCSGEGAGSGTVRVKLQVKVVQLASTVKDEEHTVLEEISSGGTDSEGSVDYDSERDGGASMVVELEGGYTATVIVGCEIYGEIENHGCAIVDMANSSNFYFKVPEVTVGWSIFNWWFSLLGS